MKSHIKNEDIQMEEVMPGIRRQIIGYDTDLMLVRVFFDKDIIAAQHKHPHQQISYIEKGTFEVEIDGQVEILKAGDGFVIPSNVMHGVKCIEQGILIDTFSPMRKDFID